MDLEHGLKANLDLHNPTALVIKNVRGNAIAVISKTSSGEKALIWVNPASDEVKEYIKQKQLEIENHFNFNADFGDEVGIQKFETCIHRSKDQVDSVVPTCCGTTLVTGYKCYKRGFPRVLPSVCKSCGDYSNE